MTDVKTYSNELLFALRMHDLPGPKIAEALAEVHSHVSETHEDPSEAFGPPQVYANELVAALGESAGTSPLWRGVLTWSTLAYGLAGAGGAWLLLDGVLAFGSGQRAVFGMPPVASLLLGLAMLAALAASLVGLDRQPGVPVLDPRTGADMTPPWPRWVLPAMVATPILSIVIAAVIALSQH